MNLLLVITPQIDLMATLAEVLPQEVWDDLASFGAFEDPGTGGQGGCLHLEMSSTNQGESAEGDIYCTVHNYDLLLASDGGFRGYKIRTEDEDECLSSGGFRKHYTADELSAEGILVPTESPQVLRLSWTSVSERKAYAHDGADIHQESWQDCSHDEARGVFPPNAGHAAVGGSKDASVSVNLLTLCQCWRSMRYR